MARIPYPTREDLEQEAAEALAGMKPMNIFKMLARADSLAPPIFETTTRLFAKGKIKLSARLRQIAILRVAGVGGFDYLISHHRPISLRVGLTQEEISASIEKNSNQLTDLDHKVAQFAQESTLTGDVLDDTFNAVRAHLGDRELVELSITVGLYNCLGRVIRSLRIDIEEKS